MVDGKITPEEAHKAVRDAGMLFRIKRLCRPGVFFLNQGFQRQRLIRRRYNRLRQLYMYEYM